MEKFTLYLGLNDKDSKVQEISTLESYKIVSNLLASDFGGGTIFEAQGVYKHEDGTLVIEPTLRIELMFTTRDKVMKLIGMLKSLFNQESVGLQRQVIDGEFV